MEGRLCGLTYPSRRWHPEAMQRLLHALCQIFNHNDWWWNWACWGHVYLIRILGLLFWWEAVELTVFQLPLINLISQIPSTTTNINVPLCTCPAVLEKLIISSSRVLGSAWHGILIKYAKHSSAEHIGGKGWDSSGHHIILSAEVGCHRLHQKIMVYPNWTLLWQIFHKPSSSCCQFTLSPFLLSSVSCICCSTFKNSRCTLSCFALLNSLGAKAANKC